MNNPGTKIVTPNLTDIEENKGNYGRAKDLVVKNDIRD